MFGGTAKTYKDWKVLKEPFKENGRLYVIVEHPVTKASKKVRWYDDQAHCWNTPDYGFVGKIFGFADENDYNICIRDIDLNKEEVEQYFYLNWEWGGKWKYGLFFGGVWYAPKDAEIPPIKNRDKVFRSTWREWVLTARENAECISGFWFNQKV